MFFIKIAIFPGSFDPINNGQLDIIKKASKIFNKIIVLLIKKREPAFFPVETRLNFIKSVIYNFENVEVDYWPKSLEEYLNLSQASIIIRGIKSNFFFEKEINFKIINESLNEIVQTVFLLPNPKNMYINTKLVQQLCIIKKNLGSVVPKIIEQEIKKEVLKDEC